MLCVLFSSYFFKNERKQSKTPHIYLLMLDASNDNSKATIELSFIKSSKVDEIPNSSLSQTSKSNQCPRN
jgi:hypothetical protein